MKFNIINRWSGEVQFTAEIECHEDASIRVKMGMALKWAYQSGAVLRGADLRGAVLSGAVLSGAVLSGADLRGADLRGAVLSGAVLSGADLSGADLRDAVLSDADLSGAVLSGADLRGADLRGAFLSGAVLSGANLSGAVLSDAVLSGADLRGADLSGADLSGADLRDADDIPAIPSLDTKILAAIEAGGKLEMDKWHKCETTHCRAGWAITLAGEVGAKLEALHGPSTAGALIYAKSYPGLRIPNFYATNNDALADIKARAATDPC